MSIAINRLAYRPIKNDAAALQEECPIAEPQQFVFFANSLLTAGEAVIDLAIHQGALNSMAISKTPFDTSAHALA